MLIKSKVRGIVLYSGAIVTLVTVCCTSLNTAGTSEVGNPQKVSAVIVDSAGRSAADVPVSLVPVDYNSLRGANGFQKSTLPKAQTLFPSGISDVTGRVEIQVTDAGMYNLISTSTEYQYKLLVSSITVAKNASVNLDTLQLREPAAVVVNIDSGSYVPGGILTLPGTLLAVAVDHPGTIAINVPSGDISIRYLTGIGDTIAGVPSIQDFVVGEGQTVFAAINGTSSVWKHSTQINLNTTAAGADVPGNTVNFPVLIRLTNSNFDFAEARSGGADVRFTKSDGTPLPYEIERWDSASSAAAIWVKVDTVFGNNATQSITMCWGNSSAASASNSAAVFGAAAGFRGVWHLAEQSGAAVDATVNHYSGSYAGNLPDPAPGVIGAGQVFGGSGNYADMGNVLNIGSSSFTVSAWIKRGNASTVQAIAGKSNGGPPTATYGYSFAFYPADTLNIAIATGGTVFGDTGSFRVKSNIAMTDTTGWHHVAAVIDRSNNAHCRVYIDGIDRSGIVEGDITAVGALSNALPFRLGEAANGSFPLAGSMDEVEMAFTIRSADWIKLEYMNQKDPDALVEFK